MTEPANLSRYQRIAPLYDLLDLPFEWGRYRRIRPLLFAGLSGCILEAGVGTGRNMPFHPRAAEVTAIDFSAAMLKRAERRTALSPAKVVLGQMDVTRLALRDAAFDGAVASFLFCVLPPDQQSPGLRELARVVRPGGILRLLEYVRPRDPLRRAVARLWEPWMRFAYGAGFDRDTERHVPAAGLELVESRFVAADILKMLTVRVPGRPASPAGAT
jgi:ubiquinone/menaquinone biosynthesis C-methylase UbiE